jgi:hypothetical protein
MSSAPRTSLPPPRGQPRPINLWRLAKDFVGIKDLQSLPLPIDIMEPYTECMKGGEHVEYAELLDLVGSAGLADATPCVLDSHFGGGGGVAFELESKYSTKSKSFHI